MIGYEIKEKVIMIYIIDNENFDGCIVARMTDGIHVDYEGLTFDEYRKTKQNDDLCKVTVEEFELKRGKYKQSLFTPLKQISKEEFFEIFRKEKINTGSLEKGFSCFFFGEFNSWGIYDCYCEIKGSIILL